MFQTFFGCFLVVSLYFVVLDPFFTRLSRKFFAPGYSESFVVIYEKDGLSYPESFPDLSSAKDFASSVNSTVIRKVISYNLRFKSKSKK